MLIWINRICVPLFLIGAILAGYLLYNYWPSVESLGIGADPAPSLWQIWREEVPPAVAANPEFAMIRRTSLILSGTMAFCLMAMLSSFASSFDKPKKTAKPG